MSQYEDALVNQQWVNQMMNPHLQGLGGQTKPPLVPKHSTVDVTAGLFVRRQFRFELERLKLRGYSISWIESKGLLGSQFVVSGPTELLGRLLRAFVDE